MNRLVYRSFRVTTRFMFRVFTRMRVRGREYLPACGPYLIASNHLSYLDGPLILVCTPSMVHGLVASYYRRPVLSPLLEALGCVFVDRTRLDRGAMDRCIGILANGGILAVAAEGTRSANGTLQEAKNGVAWLANRAGGMLVIPVAVSGTEAVASTLRLLRRPTIEIAYGHPIEIPGGVLGAHALREATESIMTQIALLLPVSYRGVYAVKSEAVTKPESPTTTD